MMPVTMRQGPIVFAHRGGSEEAQLPPPTGAPKVRAGTVREESDPTRPVIGTAIVEPARPRTRRARSR